MQHNEIKINVDYEDPMSMGNLVEKLDDEQAKRLGHELLATVNADIRSRSAWVDANTEWLKLAAQVRETKSFPWPNASNVKYPLLAISCVQFQSRSLPALIKDNKPVKAGVLGADPDQMKKARAMRIETHMSWQVFHKMTNWVDDMDRLLYVLPISGLAHKKVYYKSDIMSPASKLILPQDMILPFEATCMKTCRRTERMTLSSNEVKSLENQGLIVPVTSEPQRDREGDNHDKDEVLFGEEGHETKDLPYTLYEIHYTYDLDGDGYREPYVFTINADDGQLLRIKPCWEPEDVRRNEENNKIIDIKPIQYFVDYMFMPHPLSATHGMGFGNLLGPINESANTTINQLIDAGTLSNMQGGFLARGVKTKGGRMMFTPGEWKKVNISPADLKNGIMPLPVRDPSSVLFQLLGMLIESGERISSVTDTMVGENPGQNTPTSNMQAMLEQGMKVFSGIFQRIYRQLGEEFKLLYHINRVYHDPTEEAKLLDGIEDPSVLMVDYEDDNIDVVVAADPKMITDAQQLLKAQGLLEMVQLGTVNPTYATRQYLIAQNYSAEEIEQAMTLPPPKPSIEEQQFQLEVAKFEHQAMLEQADKQLEVIRIQSEARKDVAQSIKLLADAEAVGSQEKRADLELVLTRLSAETNEQANNLLTMLQAAKTAAETEQIQKGENNAESGSGGKTSGGAGKTSSSS